MNVRSLFLVMVIVASMTCSACHHIIERQVIRQEMPERERNMEIVMSARLRNGDSVVFDRHGASYMWMMHTAGRELGIAGMSLRGEYLTIPISSIVEARVRTREFNGVGTTLGVITIASVGLLAVAISILSHFRVH